jgi:hypothetical protein
MSRLVQLLRDLFSAHCSQTAALRQLVSQECLTTGRKGDFPTFSDPGLSALRDSRRARNK